MEATSDLWGDIERSESYLVCSMYEEAKSLSSSIVKQIFGSVDVLSEEALGSHQFYDMLESAGMVLVQSLHGLGRTGEILDEIRQVFGEVVAVPVQVLLTGICLQISNGSYSGVREILEEFFSIWVYKDDHYVVDDAVLSAKGFHGKISLGIDEYMEAVELYTFGVLGKDANDVGLAISWVEKAALPEERRQGLLRRLDSLLSLISANVPEPASCEEKSSYGEMNSNKSLANDEHIQGESCRKPCRINHMLCSEEKTSCFNTDHSQTNGVHEKSNCRFLEACVFIPSESSCSYSIHTKHHNNLMRHIRWTKDLILN